MITLTAKVDIIKGNYIGTGTKDFDRNNISDNLSSVNNKRRKTQNPFIIGASKLGDNSTFSKSVNYFIGSQLSDENGNFKNPYLFSVLSLPNKITSLTIAFDTFNNRHPKSLRIDGVDYYDDDAIFTISGLPSLTEHSVEIANWNYAKYPLVISGIYVEVSVKIDKTSLISFDSAIIDRSDIKFPSYGIISNTGNISFKDLDGEIKDYVEQRILTSDINVYAYLKDTLTKKEEQIAVFETRDLSYDNDNRSVSISLKDDLEEWQDIEVEEISYDPRNPTKNFQYMWQLYNILWEKTPKKYNMLPFEALDRKTTAAMSKVKINHSFLKKGNLWSQWQKVCEACGCYIYKNHNGETVFNYTYGS